MPVSTSEASEDVIYKSKYATYYNIFIKKRIVMLMTSMERSDSSTESLRADMIKMVDVSS